MTTESLCATNSLKGEIFKWAENYLSHGKKFEVVSCKGRTLFASPPTSTEPPSYLKTALKVTSYFLIVPLIAALLIKGIYRCTHDIVVLSSISPHEKVLSASLSLPPHRDEGASLSSLPTPLPPPPNSKASPRAPNSTPPLGLKEDVPWWKKFEPNSSPTPPRTDEELIKAFHEASTPPEAAELLKNVQDKAKKEKGIKELFANQDLTSHHYNKEVFDILFKESRDLVEAAYEGMRLACLKDPEKALNICNREIGGFLYGMSEYTRDLIKGAFRGCTEDEIFKPFFEEDSLNLKDLKGNLHHFIELIPFMFPTNQPKVQSDVLYKAITLKLLNLEDEELKPFILALNDLETYNRTKPLEVALPTLSNFIGPTSDYTIRELFSELMKRVASFPSSDQESLRKAVLNGAKHFYNYESYKYINFIGNKSEAALSGILMQDFKTNNIVEILPFFEKNRKETRTFHMSWAVYLFFNGLAKEKEENKNDKPLEQALREELFDHFGKGFKIFALEGLIDYYKDFSKIYSLLKEAFELNPMTPSILEKYNTERREDLSGNSTIEDHKINLFRISNSVATKARALKCTEEQMKQLSDLRGKHKDKFPHIASELID